MAIEDNGAHLAKVLWYYNLINSVGDKKIYCPFHNDPRPSMTVDYKNGVCFCFGCQVMANAFKVVREIESKRGLNDLQAYLKYLRILRSDKCSNVDISYHTEGGTKNRKEYYDMAYDYYHGLPKVDWCTDNSCEVLNIKDYMLRRGFNPSTLNAAGARITYNKNYMLVFPLMDNGKFRGWVSRTNIPAIEKKRKYLYNKGFSRAETLAGCYGKKRYVFLVEGYMDRLKFVQYGIDNCAAVLGWKVTSQQIAKLRAAGVDTVISALDNDDCGRKGTEYLSRFFSVRRFCYFDGIKDPGEMTRDMFVKMYNKTMEDITNGDIVQD